MTTRILLLKNKGDISMHKIYTTVILVVMFTLFAACGRQKHFDNEFEARSLSILTYQNYIHYLRQIATNMTTEWEVSHSEYLFELNIDLITDYSLHDLVSQLQVIFASGERYDMILLYDIPIWGFANAGYLTNIYTLMDPDPFVNPLAINTSLSDFFEQPLRAIEIRGGLYSFPIGFGFHYVFINVGLPQHIIDWFTASDTMSICDMMSIYLDIVRDPDFEHMYFSSGFPGGYLPCAALSVFIGNFVNFNNRTADLQNPEFIYFLTKLQKVFNRPVEFGIEHLVQFRTASTVRVLTNHVFHVDTGRWNPAYAFVNSSLYHPRDLIFYHARPITDTNGHLILDTWHYRYPFRAFVRNTNQWLHVIFPAVGNSELAWEFTQHIVAFGNQWPTSSFLASPIVRELFRPHVIDAFRAIPAHPVDCALNIRITDCINTLNKVLDGIAAFNEMPMTPATSHIPNTLFEYDLDLFMASNITAEEFARRLQNSITMWLAE